MRPMARGTREAKAPCGMGGCRDTWITIRAKSSCVRREVLVCCRYGYGRKSVREHKKSWKSCDFDTPKTPTLAPKATNICPQRCTGRTRARDMIKNQSRQLKGKFVPRERANPHPPFSHLHIYRFNPSSNLQHTFSIFLHLHQHTESCLRSISRIAYEQEKLEVTSNNGDTRISSVSETAAPIGVPIPDYLAREVLKLTVRSAVELEAVWAQVRVDV